MFAMDLARYQDIAEAIVNNASRELSIEKGVQEVSQIWSGMEFQLLRHTKAGEDRGFVLGSVDELNQVYLLALHDYILRSYYKRKL